jgi:hypothetical protein
MSGFLFPLLGGSFAASTGYTNHDENHTAETKVRPGKRRDSPWPKPDHGKLYRICVRNI